MIIIDVSVLCVVVILFTTHSVVINNDYQILLCTSMHPAVYSILQATEVWATGCYEAFIVAGL